MQRENQGTVPFSVEIIRNEYDFGYSLYCQEDIKPVARRQFGPQVDQVALKPSDPCLFGPYPEVQCGVTSPKQSMKLISQDPQGGSRGIQTPLQTREFIDDT